MAKVQGEEATLASQTMTTMRRRVVKEARKVEQAASCKQHPLQASHQILLSDWLPEYQIMELPYPGVSLLSLVFALFAVLLIAVAGKSEPGPLVGAMGRCGRLPPIRAPRGAE